MPAPLIILAIAFAIQLVIPKAPAWRGLFGVLIFLLAAGAIFGNAAYQSWQQYLIWKSNDLGKLLLPPNQGWSYFVFYAHTRFFNNYFLSLGLGLLALTAAKYFNKKYQERFFEPVEPYLLAMALFVVGHPLWLFYLIILFALVLLIQILNAIRYPLNAKRLSLYYFWLPAGIFTILISKWLEALPWWASLKL